MIWWNLLSQIPKILCDWWMANFLHDIYIMKYAAIHVPSWFRTSSSTRRAHTPTFSSRSVRSCTVRIPWSRRVGVKAYFLLLWYPLPQRIKCFSDLGLAPCQDRIGAPKEQVAAFSEEGEAIRGFFKWADFTNISLDVLHDRKLLSIVCL